MALDAKDLFLSMTSTYGDGIAVHLFLDVDSDPFPACSFYFLLLRLTANRLFLKVPMAFKKGCLTFYTAAATLMVPTASPFHCSRVSLIRPPRCLDHQRDDQRIF